jgi:ABC-type transporter MlaC component
MEIQGKVIEIVANTDIPKKDGGTYKGTLLTYRNKENKITEKGFTAQTLKYNAALANGLNNLQKDDDFILVVEKEGDFWNAKEIKKAAPQPVEKQWNGSKTTATGQWADKAEREANGVRIVRQNALGHAVALLTLQGKKAATPEDVISFAKEFEAFVMSQKSVSDELIEMEDDIPV